MKCNEYVTFFYSTQQDICDYHMSLYGIMVCGAISRYSIHEKLSRNQYLCIIHLTFAQHNLCSYHILCVMHSHFINKG